jgi:hypothetical protein
MNNIFATIKDKIIADKELFIISILYFLFIYLSTFNKSYGLFIDEFYYLACANHPAFGYVDHPPLAPFFLMLIKFFFGSSIYAIRFFPAAAGAATVYLSGKLAGKMGGGKFAQITAAAASAGIPALAVFASFYSMNVFEPLLALILIFLVIDLVNKNKQANWIPIGVVMGLGMMNKHTFALVIAALLASLILTGRWKLFINKWFAAGAAIAFLIFLPNVIWQMVNNYPSLEFYRTISTKKNIYTPPLQFIIAQLITMSPFVMPVWLAGVIYLLAGKKYRMYNFISVFFLISFAAVLFSGSSRPDRLMYIYPVVIPGGAIFFNNVINKFRLKYFRPFMLLGVLAGVILSLPLILPYYSYDSVAAYVKKTGFNTEMEKGKKPLLPQILADRIGWEDKVKLVIDTYNKLNPEEKSRVIIACNNYGDAGAVEYYGKGLKLPPVVCAHNNYFLWSKNRLKGDILLQLTKVEYIDGFKKRFDSVRVAEGEFQSSFVSPHENNLRVLICTGPKMPLAEMLDKSKFYY